MPGHVWTTYTLFQIVDVGSRNVVVDAESSQSETSERRIVVDQRHQVNGLFVNSNFHFFAEEGTKVVMTLN